MHNLDIKGNNRLPEVHFKAREGLLEISGRSIPEDAPKFYDDLLDWLKEYKTEANNQITLNIQLEYFNTVTSRCLVKLLKLLEHFHIDGISEIVVNWIYEDDDPDLKEVGEDYMSFIKVPFNLIPVAA